ncbi:MAG TPA: hypothetical protein V6D48_15215 [Oculatellaceae cyanobacterium]
MMRLKSILLGAALTGVTLIAPSNLVQAQVCPRPSGVVPPANATKAFRNEQLNYRFQIPANYKTMALNNKGVLVLDPKRYEEAQCLVKIRAGTELPDGISVYVQSVSPGNRSVTDLVRQRTFTKITGTTKVANQNAVTYTTDTMGYGDTNVSFFTPDRKHMITVSSPFQSRQNSRGERVRGAILNKRVFDTVVSTFSFVRR